MTIKATAVRAAIRELGATVEVFFDLDYDSSQRAWNLSWSDGPSVGAVRVLLADKGLGEVTFKPYRSYTVTAIALSAIRACTDNDDLSEVMHPRWANRTWLLESALTDVDYPAEPRSPRERVMLEFLLEAATSPGHQHPDSTWIERKIPREGVGWILERAMGAGRHTDPIDLLTFAYAEASPDPMHLLRWRWQARPMPAEVAVSLVYQDADAGVADFLAALTVNTQLQAAIEQRSTVLSHCARTKGAHPQDITKAIEEGRRA